MFCLLVGWCALIAETGDFLNCSDLAFTINEVYSSIALKLKLSLNVILSNLLQLPHTNFLVLPLWGICSCQQASAVLHSHKPSMLKCKVK